jgi:opacity protein-like surface antigen
MIGIGLGVNRGQPGASQTLSAADTPALQNTYTPDEATNTKGLISLFMGAERSINPYFAAQFGLGAYFAQANTVTGTLQQSIGSTVNSYNYQYSVFSQQLLAESKLLFTGLKRVLPYVSVGLGAALNHTDDYSATAQADTGGTPPSFDAHNETNFSYSVGLGVEMMIMPKFSLGIGYRYTNLGTVSLDSQDDSGALQNKNYINNAGLATLTYLF